MKPGALLLAALAVGLCGCGHGGPFCDADALNQALADAAPGDVVQVGACTITGPVTVPAGVTLEGTDPDASRIAAPVDGEAVVLHTGGGVAKLAHVTVEAAGLLGVHSTGSGAVALEDVHVIGSRGVGVFLDAASDATLTHVHLVGPLTVDPTADPAWFHVASSADALPACTGSHMHCTPGDTIHIACPGGCAPLEQVCNPCGDWVTLTATHGLVLVGVAHATLQDVDATGFVQFGAVIVDQTLDGTVIPGTVSWSGGGVTGNAGVGLEVTGQESVTADGLDIRGTYEGVGAAQATVYGGVFANGADVTANGLAVSDNFAYGLLHVGATATYSDLTVNDNGAAGVWVGQSDGFSLDGGHFDGNAFAGLLVDESQNVDIRNTDVGNTVSATLALHGTAPVTVGDGIQLMASTSSVSLDTVTLSGNARAGLVVDLDGGTGDGIHFTNVTADAAGTALGAMAGNQDASHLSLSPVAPGGWDTGITRTGAAATNDAAHSGTLDVAGVPVPEGLPDPGIAGVVTPCD